MQEEMGLLHYFCHNLTKYILGVMVLHFKGMLLSNLRSLGEISPQMVHKIMVADDVGILQDMMEHDINR